MSYEILKQKIEPNTDFLEHFVKFLPILQDWERIMVWEIKKVKAVKLKMPFSNIVINEKMKMRGKSVNQKTLILNVKIVKQVIVNHILMT